MEEQHANVAKLECPNQVENTKMNGINRVRGRDLIQLIEGSIGFFLDRRVSLLPQ